MTGPCQGTRLLRRQDGRRSRRGTPTQATRKHSGSYARITRRNGTYGCEEGNFKETGVRDFSEAIYKYAANMYHETYLSWKSIIWLQNILEKKGIPVHVHTGRQQPVLQKFHTSPGSGRAFMNAYTREIDFKQMVFFWGKDDGVQPVGTAQ
jgi:hypothetical protein